MKKIIIYSLFLVLNINTFGQTKAETEEWIISKLEYYSIKSDPHNNIEVKIKDKKISIFRHYGWYETLSFKEISEIGVYHHKDEKYDVYKVILYCREKKNCLIEGKFEGEKLYPQEKSNNHMLVINLRKEFGDDDLPKRMEKALLHLIKLNGGSAKIYKEAF